MKKQYQYILILIFFWTIRVVYAQQSDGQPTVEIGKKQIDISEPFTISVIQFQTETQNQIVFPDLIGFQKKDQSILRGEAKSSTGKKRPIQTIIQNYYAEKGGIYTLPMLSILVNGQTIKAEGGLVDVKSNVPSIEETIIDIETADAFFVLITDKRRVYVGEGFNLRLSFFVAEDNPIDMDFYMIDKQLSTILQKIKPANCWEESFEIREIPHFPTTINSKNYIEYRIFQASYFPITNQKIILPSVGLTMKLVEEKAKKKIESLKNFTSKPVVIEVMNLPNYLKKEQTSVGQYHLNEKVKRVANSFEYVFEVEGLGNLLAAAEPIHSRAMPIFDVYPPTVSQTTSHDNNQISTKKTFTYQLIPKQAGKIDFKGLFYWPYFNPQKARYDTLFSAVDLMVLDKNVQLSNLQAESTDPFGVYKDIDKPDKEVFVDYSAIIKNIINVLLVGMLGSLIFLFRRK